MGFFWRHKIFTAILAAVVVYCYRNPGGRFGYIGESFVIFNRTPIAFFDAYIDLGGKSRLLDDVDKPTVIKDWWNRIQDLTGPEYRTATLVVGAGANEESLTLPQGWLSELSGKGVVVKFLSTPAAALLYNSLKDEGKPVAALIKIKR